MQKLLRRFQGQVQVEISFMMEVWNPNTFMTKREGSSPLVLLDLFELDTPTIASDDANENQTPGWLLGYEPSESSPTSD